MAKEYSIIVGARPNFVKLSALLREAKSHPDYKFTVIHTGQHYDKSMSDVFFNELEIPKPDVQLEDAPLGIMVERIKEKLSGDVIVFGDTRSSLAGALASKGRKLVHIEAGLRSFDNRMPEETNRIVIDRLSDVLLCSEESGNTNLKNEGLSGHLVGNIMLETLSNLAPKLKATVKLVVATIHRQENISDKSSLTKILNLLSQIPNVVLVLHPATEKKVEQFGLSLDNINVIPPLGYIDFMSLVSSSFGVITDSGGIQEEATYLGKSCATLRDNTERPSTLSGSNKLFFLDSKAEDIINHLHTSFEPQVVDTRVAEKIFKYI